jgi:hypothetical protein
MFSRRKNEMLCQTIKKDKDCYFSAADGCAFVGGQCRVVVERCEGCNRIEEWPEGRYCSSYPAPEKRWTLGMCNLATHIKLTEEATQKTLNPLKASKRKAGAR